MNRIHKAKIVNVIKYSLTEPTLKSRNPYRFLRDHTGTFPHSISSRMCRIQPIRKYSANPRPITAVSDSEKKNRFINITATKNRRYAPRKWDFPLCFLLQRQYLSGFSIRSGGKPSILSGKVLPSIETPAWNTLPEIRYIRLKDTIPWLTHFNKNTRFLFFWQKLFYYNTNLYVKYRE